MKTNVDFVQCVAFVFVVNLALFGELTILPSLFSGELSCIHKMTVYYTNHTEILLNFFLIMSKMVNSVPEIY